MARWPSVSGGFASCYYPSCDRLRGNVWVKTN